MITVSLSLSFTTHTKRQAKTSMRRAKKCQDLKKRNNQRKKAKFWKKGRREVETLCEVEEDPGEEAIKRRKKFA